MILNKNHCDFFPKIITYATLKHYLKPDVLDKNLETLIVVDNLKVHGFIMNNQYVNDLPQTYFLSEYTPFIECLRYFTPNQNFFIVQNDIHEYLGCIQLSTILKHLAHVNFQDPDAHIYLLGLSEKNINYSNELLKLFIKENIDVQHFQILRSNPTSALEFNYYIFCQISNVDDDHLQMLLKKYNFFIEYHKPPISRYANSKKSFDYLMNFMNLDVAQV